MQENNQQIVRIAIAAVAVLFVGVIIWAVVQSIAHAGKIAVGVTVYPEDSTVYVDGKYSPGNTAYVTPGQHTFVAQKTGFDDARITLVVDTSTQSVTLLPTPVSDEAIAWTKQNGVQAKREELGGVEANQRGLALRDRYPIIDDLPYTAIGGPFQIDYGFTGTDDSEVFILIHNSTPSGRQNALQWIRDQGYDPTLLDIRYDEYENPLTGGV